MIGFYTLLYKEIMRFSRVGFQTVGAPILTSFLYFIVFSYTFDGRMYGNFSYQNFLLPGLIMVSIANNAFANSLSSLVQSKVSGYLVFILLSPLKCMEVFAAYVLAALFRGLLIGSGTFICLHRYTNFSDMNFLFMFLFGIFSGVILGMMGFVAGVLCDKYEHAAAFQNLFVMPATFLSGAFYSIDVLSPFWRKMSYFNPMLYMVDGFRYGFLGKSFFSPNLSLAILFSLLFLLAISGGLLLRSGYKLRG